MKTEVLVECPICRRDKWVAWEKRWDTTCYECPNLSESPPKMVPQIKDSWHEAVSVTYITREVDENGSST